MSGFRFELQANTLMLHYEPGADASIDMAALREALREQGFAELFIREEALLEAVQRAASSDSPFSLPVGERRDGSYMLKVAEDMMAVWLTLVPPFGGKPVGNEVTDELRQRGVVFGVLAGRLQAALLAGQCEDLLIAQGQPPEDGEPARFESLLPDVKEKRPQVDQNGIVDYRNLGQILIVHPQDPLLRRIPAIPGKSGTNVRGEIVLARQVANPPFSAECTGTATAADDPDVMVSAITGQPVLIDNGVVVNPVIEVPAVDLESGNVCFEGTVKVLGDVRAGMRVEAGGDVFVQGMVEAAEIVAGGDVVIKGGVVGQLQARAGGEGLTSTARVLAQGNVSALFMENAEVRSQQSVLITDYANQCLLLARNEIVVGKSGGRRGTLIGGYATAMLRLQADTLGAPSGVLTRVQVGMDPFCQEQQQVLNRKVHALEAELLRIDQLLAFFANNPRKAEGGLLEKAQRSREAKQAELQAREAELQRLLEEDARGQQARVEVRRRIHGGSEIRIGARCWQVLEDQSGCTLALHENEITRV